MIKKLALIFALFLLVGCAGKSYAPAKDEISLAIRMAAKEDVDLFLITYQAGEVNGSGGMSNADKSPLKMGEELYYSLDKQQLGADRIGQLTLTFTVVIGYNQPSFDDDYPKECTYPAGQITLHPEYGQRYAFVLHGDRESGFTVERMSK